MKIALSKLWPHYIGPLEKGEAVQGPRLMNKIKPLMQKMLSDLEIGCLDSDTSASETKGASRDDRQSKMLLEIPYMSKFLLLAGYIASRNAPTSDRAVFDTGYSNKRRRKDSQAMDRDVERSMAAKLRGTHPFPLERLLHIFYFVCEQHMPESDAPSETEDAYREWAAELQVSDVFVQISSLAALGFISRTTADILSGPTFRCNISDDLAYEIAKNVDVRLNDYLKIG
jgi:origin recognition complex subunit 5